MSLAPWLERLSTAKSDEMDPMFDPTRSFDDSGARELQEKLKLSNTTTDGMDSREIDPYRQGVEITRQNYRFMTTQPKFWAGNIKHWVEPSFFGNPVDFTKFDNTNEYHDTKVSTKWDPVAHLDSLTTSFLLFNDGEQQRYQSTIDPFSIPSKKFNLVSDKEQITGIKQEGGFVIEQKERIGSPDLILLENSRQRFSDHGAGKSFNLKELPISMPPITSGMVFWGDLNSPDTIIDSNNFVQQLGDRSGNERHFIQGTASNRPLLIRSPSDFGSQPAMQFDGIDDYLQSSVTFSMGTTASTIYSVINFSNKPNFNAIWTPTNLAQTRQYVHYNGVDSPTAVSYIGTFPAADERISISSFTTYRFASVFNPTAGNADNISGSYINGVDNSFIVSTNSFVLPYTGSLHYMGTQSPGIFAFSGSIATILVFSEKHSPEQVALMDEWLEARYNTTNNTVYDMTVLSKPAIYTETWQDLTEPIDLPYHDEIQTTTVANPLLKQLTNPSNDIILALISNSNLDLDETSEGIFGFRSSKAGFEYGTKTAPLYGTDSIAFGGLQRGW